MPAGFWLEQRKGWSWHPLLTGKPPVSVTWTCSSANPVPRLAGKQPRRARAGAAHTAVPASPVPPAVPPAGRLCSKTLSEQNALPPEAPSQAGATLTSDGRAWSWWEAWGVGRELHLPSGCLWAFSSPPDGPQGSCAGGSFCLAHFATSSCPHRCFDPAWTRSPLPTGLEFPHLENGVRVHDSLFL